MSFVTYNIIIKTYYKGEMNMSIGKNIKERREKLGLTQLQLVEKAKKYVSDLEKEGIESAKGFDQAMLSKWENEEINPSIEKIRLLADLLDIRIDYLLDKEQKDNIVEIFYNEGLELAKEYYKGSKSMSLKLYNVIKLKNPDKIILLLLELFVVSSKGMPEEMSQIILEFIIDEDFKKFENYIYSFIMGFNNGVNGK